MKEVDEDAEQDESGEDDDEENGSCEENGEEKPVVKRDGTMVVTAAVSSSTVFLRVYVWLVVCKVFSLIKRCISLLGRRKVFGGRWTHSGRWNTWRNRSSKSGY